MDNNHKPLLGVKVFVDVRSTHANHSTAVSEELRKLGAVVLDKLLPTVTHIIFKDGSKTTEARGNKFGAHIVNVSWVDSCKQANDRVPEHLHSINTASNKKKQRSMQPKDFNEEVKQASDKLARVKKRRSDVQIPSPLTIVADRINLNNYISAPRTPPAMQKRLEQLRLRASSNKSNLATSTNKTPVSTLQPMLTNDLGMSPTLRPSQKEPSMAVDPSYTSRKVISQRDIIVPETPLQWNIKSAQTLQFSPTPNKAAAESSNMVLCTPVAQQHKVEEAVPPILDLSGSLSPTLDWDDSIESFLNVKLNASDNLFTPPSPTRDQSIDNLSVNRTSDSADTSKSTAYNNDTSASKKATDSDNVARLQQKLIDRTIESVSSNENGSFSVIKSPLPRKSTGGTNAKGSKSKPAVSNKRRSSFVPPRPLSDKTEKVQDKKKIDDDDVVGSLLAAHSQAMKSSQQLLGNLSQDNSRNLSKPASNTSLFSAFSKLKPARKSGFIPPTKSKNDNVKESQEIPLFNQVVPETPKAISDSERKLAGPVISKTDTTSHISVKSDKSALSIITLSDSETENCNLPSTAKENQPKTKSSNKLVSEPVTNPKRKSLSVKRKPLTAVTDKNENDANIQCSNRSLTTETDASASSHRQKSKASDKIYEPDTSYSSAVLSDAYTNYHSSISNIKKSKARRKSSVVNRNSVSAHEEKNMSDTSIHRVDQNKEAKPSSSWRESEIGNKSTDPDTSNATSVLSDTTVLDLTNNTTKSSDVCKSRGRSLVVNRKSVSALEVERKKDAGAQNTGEAKSSSSCRISEAINETTDQDTSNVTSVLLLSDASMAHQSLDSLRSDASSRSRRRMSAASSNLLSNATPSSARRSKRMSLMATPSKELQMSSNSIAELSEHKRKTSTVSDGSLADMSLLTPRRSKRLSIVPSTAERPPRAPSANTTFNLSSASIGPSKGRKSASETSLDTSTKASHNRSRDQVVPNSSMASMSCELTDFHSPALKTKKDRHASSIITELPPTPDTSNSWKPSAKRRRQSSVVTETSAESYSDKKDNLVIDDIQPVTKRRKTIIPKGSASVKKPLAELNTASKVTTVPKRSISKPKETLNWINFSKTESDKRFHNSSISSQSELDEDAVWMFNSPPSTPAEPNSSINEVPSTTKSPTVNSRVGRITEKENRPGISSDVVKKKTVNGLEIGDYRNTRKNSNIVLTSLHSGDRTMVKSIVKSLGGYDISTEVNHKTTHVVCGDGRRTMNVLQGISQGCWIVSVEWILSSLGADQWLTNEEDFLMTDAFRGATKQRRRHILGQNNKLFATIGQIYVSPGTKPPQDDLISLVHMNGGKVAKTRRASKIVVGRECDASKNRSVIREAWILDCVTAQRLLDYKPYKWRLPSDSSSSDCEDNDMLHNIFSS